MDSRFDLNIVSQLCSLIRDQDIDIIHTHGYKSDILGVIAARKTGIKSVTTPHGFENSKEWKLRLYIWLGCLSFRFFDKVVPLSTQLLDDVNKLRVKPEKIQCIQNGVDLDEVDEHRVIKESRPVKAGNEKIIGFIGQMISRKNMFDILDVFEGLSQKNDGLRLMLLGDGEERKPLERYAATLQSSKQIEFLGFRNDRLELLSNFDLFVMTSTLEGIPRCLMEAMAMGIPVAAYDIPGVDQLIKHEETGLLAPLGDKAELTNCWEKLLTDDNLSRQVADRARDFVNTHYSARRMAQEYTGLFEELVSN